MSHPEPKKKVHVKVKPNRPVEITITGNRDPRGPDNNIYVWIDDDGLHIKVLKAERCFKYRCTKFRPGYVELIQT